MLGFGWLTLRQAQEALDSGRLEEAERLLSRPEAIGRKGASTLLQQVAKRLIERGREHWKHDNMNAAWNDLLQAEKIGGCVNDAARLRQALTGRAFDEAKQFLDAGEPG